MQFRPKKRFGQNFLDDKNIIHKIVSAFEIKPKDLILEIGPGEGALTKYILEKTQNLIVVEIDKYLSQSLKEKFPHLKIINKDILECDFKTEFYSEKYRVIGNLPYYITSQILFQIFDNAEMITDALIMVQKEVGQRMVAYPGTKDYGILSVFTQYYSKPKILFTCSPNVFYPRPEVESVVIKLQLTRKFNLERSIENIFKEIVKISFNQRRKTLKNALSRIFKKEHFQQISFDFSKRAEELNLEDFIYLAQNFAQINLSHN